LPSGNSEEGANADTGAAKPTKSKNMVACQGEKHIPIFLIASSSTPFEKRRKNRSKRKKTLFEHET